MRQIERSVSQRRKSSPPAWRTLFTWWLAVLAIILHSSAPFFGYSHHAEAPRPQAHDHAGHEHGGIDAAAHHAPNSPIEICIGDCPISVGGNSPLALHVGPDALPSPAISSMVRAVAVVRPRAFDPAVFHQPRAPPLFT
jgi:hypothetical protein